MRDGKENKSKLYPLVIVIIGAILTNFIWHPIFSPPRLSNIHVTPLYVQSEMDSSPNYFIVYEIMYEIEVPFVPLFKDIVLEVPGDKNKNIQLITGRLEKNPDISIKISPEKLHYNFVNLSDGKIPISITTYGFKRKTVIQNFLVREKVKVRSSENRQWWTDITIKPSLEVSVTGYLQVIGTGIYASTSGYLFYETRVTNHGDLPFRGYVLDLMGKNAIVCDDFRELLTHGDDQGFILIDLHPGETKKLLILYPLPPEVSSPFTRYKFNFTSETICFGAWRKYMDMVGNPP